MREVLTEVTLGSKDRQLSQGLYKCMYFRVDFKVLTATEPRGDSAKVFILFGLHLSSALVLQGRLLRFQLMWRWQMPLPQQNVSKTGPLHHYLQALAPEIAGPGQGWRR